MKALIDADIFQWEFGNASDNEFKPIPWPFIQSRIQGRIDKIVQDTEADEYQLYLTSDDKSNFRYDIATIREYKGNRKDVEKPYWYTHIRNFLVDYRGAIEVFGQEADDAISIAQYKDYYRCKKIEDSSDIFEDLRSGFIYAAELTDTVICSKDKDLLMVPGYHYNWAKPEEGVWWQDEIPALRSFYCQLVTGDPVDNIPGLYGVGAKSKLIADIKCMDSECDMLNRVYEEYVKRFGAYAEQFITENGRLLWMRRKEGELWVPPFQN